jgi:peptidylprolyl isomerase
MKSYTRLASILLIHQALITSSLSPLTDHHSQRDSAASRRSFIDDGCRSIACVTLAVNVLTHNPYPALANTGDGSLSDLSTFSDGPRGLRYKIIQRGEGEPPMRGQQIKAKYTLWTGGFGEDGGKQVDSNTGFLGKPLSVIVGVGRVIKGWDLTLLDMKPGEIRRIVVPSDLGYGDRGAGGSIPPKATLYFEMEITSVDPMVQLNDRQKKWLDDNPL